MVEFPPVYIETTLICHICEAIIHPWTKHHLRASHVVVDNIIKSRHPTFEIDQEEKYLLLGCQLNSLISRHEINKPTL